MKICDFIPTTRTLQSEKKKCGVRVEEVGQPRIKSYHIPKGRVGVRSMHTRFIPKD